MKSYNDILVFLNTANGRLERDKFESKFRYALSKVAKSTGKLWAEFEEQREEIRIENCAVDEKGVILRDERGAFRFTKDGLKEANKKISALAKSSVDIEPYFASEIPDDLTPDEREIFEGFVIREHEEPAGELVNGKTNHEEATQ